MTYDELVLKISDYNGEAIELCNKLFDEKKNLTPQEKAVRVREILDIRAKADELLRKLPEY